MIAGAELSTAPFFFSVFVELRSSKDCHPLVAIAQGNCRVAFKPFLVVSGDRKYDGNGLIDDTLVDDTTEVLALQVLTFSHEARQRSGPALRQNLNPLEVELEFEYDDFVTLGSVQLD